VATALVTGGTGFVGSHVVRELIAQGHRVRVLHRASSRLDALAGMTYDAAIGSLSDGDSLRTACQGVDWVFHIAAVADYWRADRERMLDVNVDGTRRILEAARAAGVQRVVFTSSAAAIGLRDDRPADERDSFNLPTDHFPYGYSKALAEDVVAEFVADGLDVVTVNPVVVMGPGDLNMISGSFITQIKRLGPLVPITRGGIAAVDVRDVARWHICAAERGQRGERYILGAVNVTYRDWFAMIAEAVGVLRPRWTAPDIAAPITARLIEVARRLGIPTPIDATQARMGIRYVYFDYHKAWKAFGPPQIRMRRSLRDTYHWYADHGYI
jgi:dihydroflavonol-4-reductase